MFARVLALLPFALFVAAQYECETGSAYCCNQSGYYGENPSITNFIDTYNTGNLIGSVEAVVSAIVGLQCTGVLGTGADCSSQPICCENNQFNGLVVVGCSPITVL